MTREAISTSAAATVVGPYSQAIVAGGFVFCSGTAGIDPDSGEVREGVRAQTEQALTNLAAILQAAGTSMDAVVKTMTSRPSTRSMRLVCQTPRPHAPHPPISNYRADCWSR
jgi:2-iminobutanoate/2-iminopropanoate deaminase